MNVETEVTRFIPRKDIVVPYKTLEKAAEEAIDYKFSRISKGHYGCQHGDNAYVIIENAGTIGCSCAACTFNRGGEENDVCKHLAAFIKRSAPPDDPPSEAFLEALKAAWWTGLELKPPETTSDPSGEDDSELTPDEPPAREPVPAPGLGEETYTQTCPHCDRLFEGAILDDVKRQHKDHVKICRRNPANRMKATETEQEETPMEKEEKKTYTHPDGTEFETSDALLKYIEVQKATEQTIAQTGEEKTVDPATFIAPMIRNLGTPQLTEAGGIRIGKKRSSGKGAETFDHFIFTLPEKDPKTGGFLINEEMTDRYGDNCTELPVRLLSDNITECFTTFYAKYGAGGIKIRGDGVNWAVTNPDGSKTYIEDPNNERGFLDDPDVKPHGILTVLVDGQNSVGTVYRFRTTGWNSIKGMLASLSLCAEIAKRAGGRIAFMPMTLVYRTKEVTPKGERYKKTIPVITVEFRWTIEQLQERSRDATRYLSAAQNNLIQLVGLSGYDPDAETIEEMEDVRAEFYPEEVEN